MKEVSKFYAWIFIVWCVELVQCDDIKQYSLLMPNVKPNKPELYLCTPVKIQYEKYYIIGFKPNATAHSAHHMLLYGCTKPGAAESVWNCGEMADQQSNQTTAPPCNEGSEILYAWARDAPTLILPEGVGFKVGAESKIQYLVLQVHYARVDIFQGGITDDSGVVLYYTQRPMSKLAGVFLLGTAGEIPPNSTEYMESACVIRENKVIHPIGYRVHTHSLGKVVSGYVIKPNNEWIELGKRDPLTPQMFYPVHHNVSITKNDRLAARCTMVSHRNTWTMIGATNKDEMCNFYLMYYVENDEPLNMHYCFTRGPPSYHWQDSGLVNIPDQEASSL